MSMRTQLWADATADGCCLLQSRHQVAVVGGAVSSRSRPRLAERKPAVPVSAAVRGAAIPVPLAPSETMRLVTSPVRVIRLAGTGAGTP